MTRILTQLELLQELQPVAEENVNRQLFTLPTVLLCSEATAEHCHRRLVLEYLADKWGGLNIFHL